MSYTCVHDSSAPVSTPSLSHLPSTWQGYERMFRRIYRVVLRTYDHDDATREIAADWSALLLGCCCSAAAAHCAMRSAWLLCALLGCSTARMLKFTALCLQFIVTA